MKKFNRSAPHRLVLSLLLINFLLLSSASFAANHVFKADIKAPMPSVYKLLHSTLEKHQFWVVFEPNIGQSLKGMAERLGSEYNKNKLEGFRSLVVCNAVYANKVSNLDPDLLALCPLRIAVFHKAGITSVRFAKPTVFAQNSAALPVIADIENAIINVINSTKQQAEK